MLAHVISQTKIHVHLKGYDFHIGQNQNEL